jgi:hypothetical protein
MEIRMEFPQKKKNQLQLERPNDQMILVYHSLDGIYLKECKSACTRDTCTTMFIAALFTIAKL